MKNILGTIERPETSEKRSRLFPEPPSQRAMNIVSRPEWRAAIEYRVNESLYGVQQLSRILFPNVPRKLPSYEEDINAQIFAEEEALRIDRNIEHLVDEEEKFFAEDAYANLELEGPPSHEQIHVEEVLRRYFLYIVSAIDNKQWSLAEDAFGRVTHIEEQFTQKTERECARGFFRDIFSYLLTRKLDECASRSDMTSSLHIIRLMNSAPYLPKNLHSDFVKSVSKKSELLTHFARIFLERLTLPTYNDLLRECETYGFDMDALRKEIRRKCEHELCEVLRRNGSQEFFRWFDFSLRQNIFSEEELSSIQSLRTAVIDHARGLIGTSAQWVNDFMNFAKECQKVNLLSAEELRTHPVVRAAGKKYAIGSFVKGLEEEAIDQACADFFWWYRSFTIQAS